MMEVRSTGRKEGAGGIVEGTRPGSADAKRRNADLCDGGVGDLIGRKFLDCTGMSSVIYDDVVVLEKPRITGLQRGGARTARTVQLRNREAREVSKGLTCLELEA
jgi:hypothetical protein